MEKGCSFKWQIFLNIEVPIKILLLSKYECEWRSIKGTILFPKKIHPSRHAGTLFAYHDGNPLTNIKKIFVSSSLPFNTIRRNHIGYYHNHEFPQFIKKLIKVSRVTPGHYDCPLRNIKIVFFLFNVWVIFEKFW